MVPVPNLVIVHPSIALAFPMASFTTVTVCGYPAKIVFDCDSQPISTVPPSFCGVFNYCAKNPARPSSAHFSHHDDGRNFLSSLRHRRTC